MNKLLNKILVKNNNIRKSNFINNFVPANRRNTRKGYHERSNNSTTVTIKKIIPVYIFSQMQKKKKNKNKVLNKYSNSVISRKISYEG